MISSSLSFDIHWLPILTLRCGEGFIESFSIISRMRTSFEGESLGAISPGLIAGSGKPPCGELQIEKREERDAERVLRIIRRR
jgi:hypothetical protein